ncbi:uncharacterized protein LOC144622294 [Crassostrea virginica]|uniref:Uncharacterized protein LOC111127667 n=1 Tax=Crassostrea virginica TaxID=6565 RepID=A0A8B8DLM3_CRAVI|nr:uncharacterized protein LOC111127667 [Crassostrea virginica]
MTALMEARNKIGLTGSFFTMTFSLTGTIGMAVDNDISVLGLFSNESCALQSAFGLITCGTIVETILFLILGMKKCCGKKKSDWFHISVVGHFMGALGFLLGCVVYGAVVTSRIYWYFWFCVFACISASGLLMFWIATQMFRRYLKVAYPDDIMVNE